ncbi:MAG: tRNA-intron lyase [Candidatus Saliniplasma sp.]
MPGELEKTKVIVKDEKEGNRLYNKGYFGKPISGGGLELNLIEAIYLLEAKRLVVKDPDGKEISKKTLLRKAMEKDKRVDVLYQVYRDMRLRGYVLKKASDPADFRVYPRGGGPSKTPTKYWVKANLETDTFDIKDIEDMYNIIDKLNKRMIIGLLDLEGDVTYYKISTLVVNGKMKKYDGNEIESVLNGYKCIIEEPDEILHEELFYGNIMDSYIEISLLEAIYLMECGYLNLKKGSDGPPITLKELKLYSSKMDDNFNLKYDIYKHLRDNHMVPKTGFKYGTAFRCYKGDPDNHHAEFIVEPVDNDFSTSWYNISKSVRVAHSVKKTFVYARDKKQEPVYFKIERVTP